MGERAVPVRPDQVVLVREAIAKQERVKAHHIGICNAEIARLRRMIP